MNKYTNPFKALEEAKTELKSLGADPLAPVTFSTPGATNPTGVAYPFPWGYSYGQSKSAPTNDESPELEWYYHILSLCANRVYVDGSFYTVIDVHMDLEGFERVCALLYDNAKEWSGIQEKYHSEGYNIRSIEPTPLVRIFTLVLAPETDSSNSEEVKCE